MDKNTLLALLLIGLVLLLWPLYMKKVVGVKENVQKPVAKSSKVEKQSREPAAVPLPENRREITEKSVSPIKVSTVANKEKPDTLVVETNLFRGLLSSAGGGTIISWKLKKYFKGDKKDSVLVELIPDSARGNLAIIPEDKWQGFSDAVFHVTLDSQWVENGKKYRMIRFSRNFGKTSRLEKEFLFHDESYGVDLKVRFFSFTPATIGERYTIHWTSGLAPTEKQVKKDLPYYQAYALQGGELLKTKGKSTGIREGNTSWVALRTKYFLLAIIPEKPQGSAVKLEGSKIKIKDEKGNKENWKQFSVNLLMPYRGAAEEAAHLVVYLGPMDYLAIKSFGVKLEKMMNFGMAIIRPFSIAFYYTLQFLYKILHNYGWAIILFSVLIKLVLYPLTRKSYKSMHAMQELQPKMTAIREKYKKDPQRMNQEIMKLYKQHGVNPMGGCLPLILQLPILYALFTLFRTTILLRQAGFLGLIKDLSAPDGILGGINLLPILMGATMIIQQKLSTQDPKQKAMAYMMPLFFSFIFYKMSAGLNLYYLIFNILTIAQEMFIRKHK